MQRGRTSSSPQSGCRSPDPSVSPCLLFQTRAVSNLNAPDETLNGEQLTKQAARYDPIEDFRSRHSPCWRLDFGQTTDGAPVQIDLKCRQILFDLGWLDSDPDLTAAYGVALLDVVTAMLAGRGAGAEADRIAHERLGRATVSTLRKGAC